MSQTADSGRDIRAAAPVEILKTGSAFDSGLPGPGVGLCLSGGGYRAMLFHIGVLWRLNEAGFLPRIDRFSSVSGGSIVSGVLALKWTALDFDQNGVARGFVEAVVRPIRELAEITLDAEAILGGLLGPGSIVSRVINAYRRHLYGEATLQDLPDRPEFVINAANVQSGALWRFSKAAMRDYRVGEIKNPRLLLATAVASSTAFPPFLSPVVIDLDPADFTPASGMDLQREPFTSKVYLSDGGVYDNLGLETVWKRYDTVLVSDGGGKMEAEGEPNVDWPRHTYRVLTLIDNQVRALRKRQVIEAFIQRSRMLAEGVDPSSPGFRSATRKGAYWGIRSDIGDYRLENALPAPFERTQELANTPTRMQTMPAELQERLINWGYAICDAAMRKHVAPEMAAPAGLPYPASGI